jgi:hypothetical protein
MKRPATTADHVIEEVLPRLGVNLPQATASCDLTDSKEKK